MLRTEERGENQTEVMIEEDQNQKIEGDRKAKRILFVGTANKKWIPQESISKALGRKRQK